MADSWNLELFYDGACPLCVKEVRLIQRLDRKDEILFTDIAEPDFDAESYGKTFVDFMAEIHARTADGEWIYGADVFREI